MKQEPESKADRMKRAGTARWVAVMCALALVVVVGGVLVMRSRSGGGADKEAGVVPADIKGKPIRPLAAVTNAQGTAVAVVSTQGNSVTQVVQTQATQQITIVAATNALQISNATASIPMVEGYRRVGFDILAGYLYAMPEEPMPTNVTVEILRQTNRIPAEVAAIDGQAVALKGFMLPMKIEKGLATEMLIMRDQSMCCYGAVPKINEWVNVKMTKQGVRPTMDQAVVLCGKLRVGEVLEDGYLKCIYNLEGDKMVPLSSP